MILVKLIVVIDTPGTKIYNPSFHCRQMGLHDSSNEDDSSEASGMPGLANQEDL